MSKEKSSVSFTIFGDRPMVGDLQLFPLSAGRVVFLQERGNPLLLDGLAEDDYVPPAKVWELLFVATRTGAELAEVDELEDDEWKRVVKGFGYDLSDEVLSDCWELFERETKALLEAQAAPKKKRMRKKKTARRKR
jgi:hypothetical protein